MGAHGEFAAGHIIGCCIHLGNDNAVIVLVLLAQLQHPTQHIISHLPKEAKSTVSKTWCCCQGKEQAEVAMLEVRIEWQAL